MNIKLQLFGAFRTLGEELELSLPDGSATVADIRSALIEEIRDSNMLTVPDKEGLVASSRFATEEELLTDDYTVRDKEVIAIIPPVAGG